MEAARNLLSPSPSFPPPRTTHFRNSLSSASTSVLMFHEQIVPTVSSVPATSITQRFSTSVVTKDHGDELKPPLSVLKEEKTTQATLDRRKIDTGNLVHEETRYNDSNRLVLDFERQLLHWPESWHVFPSLQREVNSSASLAMDPSKAASPKKHMDVELCDALTLAKEALSASKEAASLAEESKLVEVDSDDSHSVSLTNFLGEEDRTVRSMRLLERRSKKRKVPKSKVLYHEKHSSRGADVRKMLNEGFDRNDPLRLFLAGAETKQLLTIEEESELIVQVQDFLKLEQVKIRLQSQFGREPTMVEWAEACGLSCSILQSQLHRGTRGREKLIYANLRMVVHIAKQYQGRGIGLQDLLQEGSRGLMRSVEKFKPQAGCRFGTYAYWWIRQTIRKAIFQHSRTIRLPENVYTLIAKVLDARRLYIQEGNHYPSKEDLAKRVGITVEKLEKLLFTTRMPLSMQQPVWADQDTTFQEVIADPGIEIPDVTVAKQLMRHHVRNLLRILSQRERQIIALRFGIKDGKHRSLSEIGNLYGLSKERVRQLESRALYKLKQCLDSQGLDAYTSLLV
ncbi:hypothetical protein FNV43_RR15779 [Rhamnella rubrinervis]|uniref:RNA polymerase sigma factor n=1 Tax=Rhamnella rubrinervis TaxID=2594499 RepID=A0A8K0GX20_9ROSA|nr:hypothetical protein FNV43_RR15779 [Rhamnella rubrinervis]